MFLGMKIFEGERKLRETLREKEREKKEEKEDPHLSLLPPSLSLYSSVITQREREIKREREKSI